jgi:hypothetical protein
MTYEYLATINHALREAGLLVEDGDIEDGQMWFGIYLVDRHDNPTSDDLAEADRIQVTRESDVADTEGVWGVRWFTGGTESSRREQYYRTPEQVPDVDDLIDEVVREALKATPVHLSLFLQRNRAYRLLCSCGGWKGKSPVDTAGYREHAGLPALPARPEADPWELNVSDHTCAPGACTKECQYDPRDEMTDPEPKDYSDV